LNSILSSFSSSKPSNSIAEGPEGLLSAFAYGDGRWATGFATGPTYTALKQLIHLMSFA